MRMNSASQYQDTPVDVKLVLSAQWVAMLFVFAYVDIFGFYRADVLDAALDGKVATTALEDHLGWQRFTASTPGVRSSTARSAARVGRSAC